MPSLRHRAIVAALTHTPLGRRPQDEAGMDAEMQAAQLRPRRFAPPRSLDRHVALRLLRDHGWRTYELAPRGAALPQRRVVYFHGGGYVAEVDPHHWGLTRRLATSAPARVLVPIYPLAPGAHADTTVPTAANIVADVIAEAGDPRLVTLCGDSAGGGMALAVAQTLRDRGIAGIDGVALILIAPWLDVTMSDPAIDPEATRDPMLSIARLRRAGELYAGPLDLRDPRVSPIYGSVAGLGPMTIFVGTRDLLLHDARRLRDEAKAHGIPVDYHEADGLIHVWPILRVPEAAAARAHMVTAIRRSQR